MKGLRASLVIVALVQAFAVPAATLSKARVDFLNSRVIPTPHAMEFMAGNEVVLDNQLKVTVNCGKEQDKAVKLVKGLFKEWFLHKPSYFHIGCDESYDSGTCSLCSKADYAVLAGDFINRITGKLAEHKCRTMMWHDMLLRKGDPRWKGYYDSGKEWADKLTELLSKDIVICDWFYDAPRKDEKPGENYPTLRYFKEKGFGVLTCPWTNPQGYAAQGAAVSEIGLDGMLATTWHHLYGRAMQGMYVNAAHAMWGTKVRGSWDMQILAMTVHLRHIGWDVPVKDYEDTGTFNLQMHEKTNAPRL